MGTVFWIKRFITVFAGAFAIICLAQLRKGHDWPYAISEAAMWSAIATAVFIGARLWQSRKGKHCALCKDTPEMR